MAKTVSWEEANKNIDPKVIAEAEELAAQDLLQMGTKMTDPKRNMYGEFMEGVVSLKDERIAELEAQLKTANESNPFLGIKPVLQEYRSGGFVNHAPDMGRISFDMPIIDARVIFNSLKVKRNETT